MQGIINMLIRLQEIDSLIIKVENIIDSMPAKATYINQSLKEVQSMHDEHKQKCGALEKKKKDKERTIEDINEKIKKIKARASEIKTNKEYQAHLKEIETIEKERYAIEDEILSLMEAIDAAGKELKTEELKVKAEKEKLEAFKKEIEKEIAEAEKEMTELRSKRSVIADTIDPEAYNEYMKAFESGAGLAVIEARDAICQGCHMNMPLQMFVEIKKNEEIIHCLQCRRILYWKEEVA